VVASEVAVDASFELAARLPESSTNTPLTTTFVSTTSFTTITTTTNTNTKTKTTTTTTTTTTNSNTNSALYCLFSDAAVRREDL